MDVSGNTLDDCYAPLLSANPSNLQALLEKCCKNNKKNLIFENSKPELDDDFWVDNIASKNKNDDIFESFDFVSGFDNTENMKSQSKHNKTHNNDFFGAKSKTANDQESDKVLQ